MTVRSRVLLSLSILLLIVPLTTFAATEGHEPVGRMTTNAAGLSIQIGSDNESVTLTISGPNNFQYSHQFASARSISLRLRDSLHAHSEFDILRNRQPREKAELLENEDSIGPWPLHGGVVDQHVPR